MIINTYDKEVDKGSKCSSALGELNSPKEQDIHQECGSENILYAVNNKSPKKPRRNCISWNKNYVMNNLPGGIKGKKEKKG